MIIRAYKQKNHQNLDQVLRVLTWLRGFGKLLFISKNVVKYYENSMGLAIIPLIP